MPRYLWQIVTAAVDANGNAIARFQPGQGEWWAPSMVLVSTRRTPQNTPFASSSYCAVYHGGIGVNDSTTLLDDTNLGSGDASSVVSGAVVMPGQALTARWTNAFPGDTAILRVYGRVYDDLVSLQNEFSPIPGARFSGSTGNGMVWEFNANVSDPVGNFNVIPSFITPSDSSIEVINIQIGVNTSAVVGNRFIGATATCNLSAATINLFFVYNGTAQAASSTIGYYFNQGISNSNVSSRYVTALPAKLILPPISNVQIPYTGPDPAGDAYFNFRITYRRFTSLTKVSYT